MKARITTNYELIITAENELEVIALKAWDERFPKSFDQDNASATIVIELTEIQNALRPDR